jgi:hypothetical protein
VTRGQGLGRAVALFGVAQLVALLLVGWVLTLLFAAPGDRSAIVAAAWVALGVQLLTFTIVRLVGREQVIAAWGLGVVVRFAVVAVWALLLVPALGLASTSALIALVSFFFVSTVVEPIFLNI